MDDKMDILLIEDNSADSNLIKIYLKEAYMGMFALTVAANLQEGLKFLEENNFDVIIIDLSLPDSTGLDTFKAVHAAALEKPIIVLTGLEDESVGISTVKLGAQDFLIKGKLGIQGLKRSINYSIERYKLLQSLSEKTKMLEEKTADLLIEKQKLAQAQKLAHIGNWEWNMKESSFTCSDELFRILGVEQSELKITYQDFLDFVYPDDRAIVVTAIEESINYLKAFDFFHRIVRRDGSVRHIHTRGELQLDEQNNILKVIGTEQDVTERKKEEELEQLSMVATKSYNAVIIADNQGRIEWVNEGFTRLFGYKLEDVQGTYGEILRRGQQTGLSPDADFYKTILREKTPLSYESKNYSKDGQEYWVVTSLTPIVNEVGEIHKIISIDSDITKQKRAEEELIISNRIAEHSLLKGNKALEELNKAKQQLEELLKVKEQFLANMSHEIRTPMNAIVGFTNLLLKSDLSAENKQYLKAIQTSGENLLVIINDILDFSKLESGKIRFENIQFKLSQLVSMIVELMLPKAVEKSIKLSADISDSIPEYLVGDPTRLNQILINFIGNAIKFTTQGGVKIAANVTAENEESVELEFKITDTGIGIPPESLPKIFESFTQASNDTTRKFGGTGLGLTITKQLVEQQGGKIAVTSKVNEGSCFSFKLTFQKTLSHEEAGLAVFNDNENKFPLEGIKILLVEDNSLNQLLAGKILSNWKCVVDVAENGLIAVEKIANNDFDLILMDIQLPEMDGHEATQYVRKEMKTPKSDVPIIAMTAHAFVDEAEKCLKSGMNDYISKPFDEKKLHSKICKMLAKNEKFISNFKLRNAESTLDNANRYADLSYLKTIAKGDNKFILKMISVFINQTPDLLKSIQLNIINEDWEALKLNIHKMKPSISFMGVKELESVVMEIKDLSEKKISSNELFVLGNKMEQICNDTIKELNIEKTFYEGA